MNTEIIYVSSNTDPQPIDTISLAEVHSVYYTIQASTNSAVSVSKCQVTHNGVSIGDIQRGYTLNNGAPLEYSTDITSYTGRLMVTPSANVTTFKIQKEVISCNLYSENTQSGRMIKATEGFAIDYVSSLPNATVRQSNNNQYVSPTAFVTANTLGPIASKNELFLNTTFEDNSAWIPYNDSVLVVDNAYGSITSYNNIDNFYYQAIDVVPGRNYRVSGTGYTTNDGTVRIGSTLELDDYAIYSLTRTDATFDILFSPTVDKIYVSVGHGSEGTTTTVSNMSFKESVPFHTYNQTQGTFYLKFNSITAGTTLATFTATDTLTRTISISLGNNLIITEDQTAVNSGAQLSVNKLAFSYSEAGIISSLNGAPVVQADASIVDNIKMLYFATLPSEFAYVSDVLSNTQLIAMTT